MVSTGIVRKWLEERGFGFITPDDGSEDIFFHATGVKRNGGVVENDKVEYEVKEEKGKARAFNVQTCSGSSSKRSSRRDRSSSRSEERDRRSPPRKSSRKDRSRSRSRGRDRRRSPERGSRYKPY
eukprot:NODE_10119_length_539_cov_67.009615_g9473_i0.p1 GENE.NODE_10119_length_539_cov_67.009615_g9473_i0~~NODE_10119_length_539_cov_67.009615_g9473_i0.p1  ORF type:complete len:125 (+),score=24.44 NODE_10119_length_539_cov_67.009615_g9473_i0:59-433(+)